MTRPAPRPPGAVLIDVRVIPRAKKTEIAGTRASARSPRAELLIRVSAPPVDGAANDAVIELLAERLALPRRNIRIVSGETSRSKRIEITGLDAAEIARRL